MTMNWYVLFISAVIPMITGFIWYNPKVLGKAWTAASGFDPAKNKSRNMGMIMFFTYLLGLFLSGALMSIVIHQMGVFSIYSNDPAAMNPGSEMMLFFEKHGHDFRTFKHGALHGFISSLTLVLPIIGIVAMFEGKGAKYVFIHVGYWALTLMLMGGLICQML